MKKLLALLLTLLMIFALPLSVMAEDVEEPDTLEESTVTEETTAEPETEGTRTNFGIFPETLSETLPIMGMGMLGIFLVTCVIILSVLILSKIGKKNDEE